MPVRILRGGGHIVDVEGGYLSIGVLQSNKQTQSLIPLRRIPVC